MINKLFKVHKTIKDYPYVFSFYWLPTLTPVIVILSIGGHGQCLACITKNSVFSQSSFSLLHAIQA